MDSQPASEDPAVQDVLDGLSRILDPCCALSGKRLSIADLGLINRVERRANTIEVGITLTDTMCEFSYRIFADIEALGQTLPDGIRVEVVPEVLPIWSPDRLSPRAVQMIKSDADRFFGNWDREHNTGGPSRRNRTPTEAHHET